MKLYNFYVVLKGKKWVIVHSYHFDSIKNLPKFGIDVETRKEAQVINNSLTDVTRATLADLNRHNRVA